MNVDAITLDLVKQTLIAWQKVEDLPSDIWQLDFLRQFCPAGEAELNLLFYDYVQALIEARLQEQRLSEGLPHSSRPPMTRAAITAVLAQDFRCDNVELEIWSALYHQYISPIPLTEADLQRALPVTPRNYRRRAQIGLGRLTWLLRRAEMEAHQHSRTQHLSRLLPQPDYLELLGVGDVLARIQALLTTPHAGSFISIEGLGGIGKTSLALATAYRQAETETWEDILWVSARQQRLETSGELVLEKRPARTLRDIVDRLVDQTGQMHLAGLPVQDKLLRLQALFVDKPYLVVIDNLETIADVEMLLPALQPGAGKTRFLLTSRQTMSQYSFVRVIPAPALSLADSQALMEFEMSRLGLVIEISQRDLKRLYHLIGGLPLALKLTAAQLQRRSLPDVLQQLQDAQSPTPYRLYTYIYRMTWEMLTDPARQLLLSTLDIAPDGDNATWLRGMSALADDEFEAALDQLLDYLLLEAGGDVTQRVYKLHRLTATFLQTDVLGGWADDMMVV
ncbi:MAG: NB-ARC domain-containing protein [Chloroflexota bacterium]